jgi:hypothetical protein
MGKTKGRYLGRSAESVDLDGATFHVRVHWAEVDGRAVPVGLDVRSFTSKREQRLWDELSTEDGSDVRPVTQGWAAISSTVMRSLPTATVVDESRDHLLALLHAAVKQQPQLARPRKALRQKPQQAKPGRKPVLSDDDLRDVVAVAYKAGGSRGRQAVLKALEGLLGASHEGQAVNAIRRARKAGYLPPATKGSSK